MVVRDRGTEPNPPELYRLLRDGKWRSHNRHDGRKLRMDRSPQRQPKPLRHPSSEQCRRQPEGRSRQHRKHAGRNGRRRRRSLLRGEGACCYFCGRLSGLKSGEQSLVNGKIAACAPNGFAHLIRSDEFEAVAKSVLLAHGRTNCHRAVGKREAQLHNFAQASFDRQHSRDPGFADVHSTAFQQTASAGTDSDVSFHFKPRLPSVVGNRSQRFRCVLSVSLQFRPSPLSAHAVDSLFLVVCVG